MQLNEKMVRHGIAYKMGVKKLLMSAGLSDQLAEDCLAEIDTNSGWAAQVLRWSQAMGRPVPERLTAIDVNHMDFRDKLFREERDEYLDAWGKARNAQTATPHGEEATRERDEAYQYHMTEVADGIADQIFLLLGDAAELGLGHIMDRVVQRVINANMAKLGADGKPIVNGVTEGYRDVPNSNTYHVTRQEFIAEPGYRPDQPIGKILKPEGWQSPDPDIQKMLFPED